MRSVIPRWRAICLLAGRRRPASLRREVRARAGACGRLHGRASKPGRRGRRPSAGSRPPRRRPRPGPAPVAEGGQHHHLDAGGASAGGGRLDPPCPAWTGPSGRRRAGAADQGQGLVAVGGRPHDLDVLAGLEQRLQPGPDQPWSSASMTLIIASPGRTSRWRRVPRPAGVDLQAAPASGQILEQQQADWPPAGVPARVAGSKLMPSSATVRATCPARQVHVDREAAGARRRCDPPPGRPGTPARRARRRPRGVGTSSLTSMPRPASGRAGRGGRPAARFGEGSAGDSDQQGPQGADAPAQGLGAALHGLGLLDDPVGRSRGIRRRSVSVASTARAAPLALAQRRVQPPGRGPGQGELEQGQQQQGADDDGDELAPHGPGVGRDRAVARVGLEQQGLAARGRDGQVDLEQAALVALEAVLGGLQVAELSGHRVVAQDLLLVHGQGVAGPDEAVPVGVDDPALGGPRA